MTLHSPAFEKNLHQRIREAIRNSPELRRERRNAKFRKHYSGALFIWLLIAFVPGFLIWTIQDIASRPATALALITLWGFSLIVFRAQALMSCLFSSRDLRPLTFLPVAPQTIFHWELQKFFRGSAISLLHFLGAFSSFAWLFAFSPMKWSAVPLLAILTWAVTIAAAAFCAARWPSFPYPLAMTGFVVVFIGIIVGQSQPAQPALALLDHYAFGLNLICPAGWPVSLFKLLLPNPHWFYLILLIPIAALLLTFRKSLVRLSGRYHYQERTVPPVSDLVPHPEIAAAAPPPRPGEPLRVGPTAIEEAIRSRQFLISIPWHTMGWFENLLWRWFTERERTLSEFVFPNGLAISGPWRTIFRNLSVAFFLALIAGSIFPQAQLWLLGIGFFVTVCHALAQILVTGRAFQLINNNGVCIPVYFGLGIGLRELAGLLVKCSVAQLPLLTLFAIVCSTVVVWQLNAPLLLGLGYGLKIAILVMAGRFIALIFGFSSGTNDSSRIRLRTASLIFSMTCLMLAFIGLAAASLFVPDQRIALPLLALTLLEAYATFRLYGWFYHANRFDLMRIPQR
jgi:hypothetical protein